MAGHHYHSVGPIFLTIPFIFKDKLNFNFTFLAIRYYFLFELTSACLWKLLRGTIFNVEQFSSILKIQNIEYFIFDQISFKAKFIFYLIEHPLVAQICWGLLILLQFSFIIGFFTRKLDILLIILYFFFAIGSFVLMNIISFETTIFLITLIPWHRVDFKNLIFINIEH